ncbi:sensor histidine kinase [Pimelobacter simplex]|uniref:sensor histidine kinase n=1 Tax=Nocardioides simplex TaxID=2045 RepID=UPI003AB01D7F
MLDDPFRDAERAGWTMRTVTTSTTRAFLRGMALWQAVMVLTIVIEPVAPTLRAALVAGHLVVAGCALLVAAGRLPAWTVLALAYAAFVADWATVVSPDNPLLLASCWMANLAAILPAFLLRGRTAIVWPLGIAVVVPVLMVLTVPDSGSTLPSAVAATTLAIAVAARSGLSFLLDFARRADAEHELADAERHAGEVRRAASRRAAEDARLLHDTVINTLGALANGGAAIADRDAVRARCARDVATLEAITDDAALPLAGQGLRQGLSATGIRIVHTGVSEDELARREALVPADVLDALTRATGELVRNAEKHSGAAEVRVDVQARPSGLVVTVSDDGVGFDGVAPAGRGLAESVLGRLRDTDIDVELVSTPGFGTRATLTWTMAAGGAAPTAASPSAGSDLLMGAVVDGLQRRASGVFALALVGIGVWLAVTNHRGQPTTEYPMVAVVAAVCGLAWVLRGDSRPRRLLLPLLLGVGSSVAFVLSAAAVDFGRTDVVLWQAICPSGPLLLVLGDRHWRRMAVWPAAMLLLTIVTTAALVAPSSGRAAVSTLVAGTACLGLVAGWAGFQRMVITIGRRVVADQQAVARLRTEVEAREAASRSRRRWAAAGLAESVAILRRVAAGDVEPTAEPLRAICVEEEAYLRQLTQLNPELVWMGDWFARALAEARTANAALSVRSGAVDAGAEVAPALGELLLTAVGAVPAGEQMTTTLFPAEHGLRFTLVGPAPHLASVARGWRLPDDVAMSVQSFGPQDLVEVVVPAAEPGPVTNGGEGQ